VTDTDRISLASNTCVPDINIVVACAEVNAGQQTQCDVSIPGGVVGEILPFCFSATLTLGIAKNGKLRSEPRRNSSPDSDPFSDAESAEN
jgi:hypothetical protein